jgi:DNA-binding XRE family transcriptional regulator
MTAEAITAWRERLGFNRSEAARALGVARNTYAAYEAGTVRIPLYIALACAAIACGLRPAP